MQVDVFAKMVVLFFVPTAIAFGGEATSQPAGPNIIVFYTSGQMSGLTGFEGGKVVKTPNLDRLAGEGVQFTRCYATRPQPGPSRAGFLTGLYPHENGVTKPGEGLPDMADTFTARLKKAGYTCGIVGKWDLPSKEAAKPGFGLTDFVATNKPLGETKAESPNGSSVHTNGDPGNASTPSAPRRVANGPSPNAAVNGLSPNPRRAPTTRPGSMANAATRPASITANGETQHASQPGMPSKTKREKTADSENGGGNGWTHPSVYVSGKKKKVDKYLTDWQADQACEFLKKQRKRPFFLWVCFDAPHPPLEYPPGDEDKYNPALMAVPAAPANTNMPQPLAICGAAMVFRQMNPETLQQDRAKYYAMLSRVDDAIGRVLERLTDLKLADNTVVVFTSDGGWSLGEHGLYGEAPAFYEETLRVPLVMRIPDSRGDCKRVSAVTSAIDLAPTFCELAGLKSPIAMRGRSLLPMIQNPQRADIADERFFEFEQAINPMTNTPQKSPARGIVTSQYKLIHYVTGGDFLYDLKNDPQETTNVLTEGRYAPVARVLRERLTRWRKESRDPVKS